MPTRFPVRLTLSTIATWAVLHGCTGNAPEPRPQLSPSPTQFAPGAEAASHDALVKRGGQLVSMGSCNDCHTPMKLDPKLGMPVPDMTRMLSGHPAGAPEPAATPGVGDQAVIGATFTSFRLPFGVVYAANLTPDRASGLGTWTAEEFIATMRTGHERGTGRQLLPPMPWQNLAGQSEEDLRAIFAYLQSIPAIDNRVKPASVPPQVVASIEQSFKTMREGRP